MTHFIFYTFLAGFTLGCACMGMAYLLTRRSRQNKQDAAYQRGLFDGIHQQWIQPRV